MQNSDSLKTIDLVISDTDMKQHNYNMNLGKESPRAHRQTARLISTKSNPNLMKSRLSAGHIGQRKVRHHFLEVQDAARKEDVDFPKQETFGPYDSVEKDDEAANSRNMLVLK